MTRLLSPENKRIYVDDSDQKNAGTVEIIKSLRGLCFLVFFFSKTAILCIRLSSVILAISSSAFSAAERSFLLKLLGYSHQRRNLDLFLDRLG